MKENQTIMMYLKTLLNENYNLVEIRWKINGNFNIIPFVDNCF
jgi:hypothetical protein